MGKPDNVELDNVDWPYAFDLLVDRLTKDDLSCGQNTPNGFTQLTGAQKKCIIEISKSCIEDANCK